MNSSLRVWHEATLSGDPAAGYEVRLDGKPLRLGAGQGGVQSAGPGAPLGLRLPNRALGVAICDEWQRAGGTHGGRFSADDIGLTRLVATMQHRVAPARTAMIDSLVQWGRDDLVRYRASEPKLAAAQAEAWDGVLDCFAARSGLHLGVVAGVLPVVQTEQEAAAWHALVASHTDAELTTLATAVPLLGSLVLALELVDGELDIARAIMLSRVDEHVQALVWGTDPDSDQREARMSVELGEATAFLRLARTPD